MTTSPVKWMTDAEFMAAPIREKALAVADSLVGQREIGDNRGPFVQRLLAKVGLGPGFPWCALLRGVVPALAFGVASSAPALDGLPFAANVKRVVCVKRVPVDAMGGSGAFCGGAIASSIVFPRGDGAKVERVYATKVPIVANVVDFKTVWDWPVEVFINCSGRYGCFAVVCGGSVTVRHPVALPSPTLFTSADRVSQMT